MKHGASLVQRALVLGKLTQMLLFCAGILLNQCRAGNRQPGHVARNTGLIDTRFGCPADFLHGRCLRQGQLTVRGVEDPDWQCGVLLAHRCGAERPVHSQVLVCHSLSNLVERRRACASTYSCDGFERTSNVFPVTVSGSRSESPASHGDADSWGKFLKRLCSHVQAARCTGRVFPRLMTCLRQLLSQERSGKAATCQHSDCLGVNGLCCGLHCDRRQHLHRVRLVARCAVPTSAAQCPHPSHCSFVFASTDT
jgi:hypothetical protein